MREHGIALKTIRVEGPDGRRIGAYVFDEMGDTGYSRRAGRTALSNKLKAELIQRHGARCHIYLEAIPERDLQVDHRVPYEVAGNAADQNQNPNDFMLLCGSANRAKSWSCEHCPNWLEAKNTEVCRSCYWAFPESYTHVATRAERRLDIVWGAQEVADYECVRAEATTAGQLLPDFVKAALKRVLAVRPELAKTELNSGPT